MKIIRSLVQGVKWLYRRRRFTMRSAKNNIEEWHTYISPMRIIMALIGVFLLLSILVMTLFGYTSILDYMPGYHNEAQRTREIVIESLHRIDSLEQVTQQMMRYNNNIAMLMDGGIEDFEREITKDSVKYSKGLIAANGADSMLRSQIEGEGVYSIKNQRSEALNNQRGAAFVSPIDGIITEHFDISQSHFGVRLAASPDAIIVAASDGLVLSSLWSPGRDYTIEVLHSGGVVTVYSNISKSLVEKGKFVKRGEVIGQNDRDEDGANELTLFGFEIWSGGKPTDPESYINF